MDDDRDRACICPSWSPGSPDRLAAPVDQVSCGMPEPRKLHERGLHCYCATFLADHLRRSRGLIP
eukprot:15457473-Alexandrium_andersonii.AAC.1